MRPLVFVALLLSQSACFTMLQVASALESDGAAARREQQREKARLLQEERRARRAAHASSVEAARFVEKRAKERKAIDRAVADEVRAQVVDESPLRRDAVVALLPIESHGAIEARTTDALDALLFLELTSTGRFRFVPRSDVEAAHLEVKAESLGDCVDARCNIELGRALAAERVLAPRLFASDGGCVVALTLFDLKTETGDWAATVKAPCDDGSLRDAARRLAAELEAPLVEAPPARMTAEREAPPAPKAPPRPVFRPGK